jgi:hypothetical protein
LYNNPAGCVTSGGISYRNPTLGKEKLQITIDTEELENVEYFNCLCSMITDDARCTYEIQSRIAMAKTAFRNNKAVFTNKLDLNRLKKLVKCNVWSTA